jgi:hypothetical protein
MQPPDQLWAAGAGIRRQRGLSRQDGPSGDFVDGPVALDSQVMVKRWRRTQPRAVTPAQLWTQPDWSVECYNHRRPHCALHGTPADPGSRA